MDSPDYSLPPGCHAVPASLLDLRPDSEIDHDLLHPAPLSSSEKNIWFFWHSGYANIHPYSQRNIRAWHRRFAKQGWVIRVIDQLSDSPLNVANFLDIADAGTFPKAFIDGRIGGHHAPQHTSDLVRFPLLLRYGGVYADVGFLQIGDLDALWSATVGNPESRFEVLSYNAGRVEERNLTNYFLCSGRNNPFFARCHQLFLALFAEDGGKESTEGMHASPLLKGLSLLTCPAYTDNGVYYGPEAAGKILTDYITQGQVISMVMQLVDDETGWNGPQYVADHIWAGDYMVGSQLINEITAWDGPKQHKLMSLSLPREGEEETEDEKVARNIVESCLSRSFGFKTATGMILKVSGDTLGSLWRKHDGSDNVPGTYAHWLRHGTIYWSQDVLPQRLEFQVIEPVKRGPLLR